MGSNGMRCACVCVYASDVICAYIWRDDDWMRIYTCRSSMFAMPRVCVCVSVSVWGAIIEMKLFAYVQRERERETLACNGSRTDINPNIRFIAASID